MDSSSALPNFPLHEPEMRFIGKRLPIGYSVEKMPKKAPKDGLADRRLKEMQASLLDSKRTHRAGFTSKEAWASLCLWIMDQLLKSPLVASFQTALKSLQLADKKSERALQQNDLLTIVKKLLKEDYIGPSYFSRDFHAFLCNVRQVAEDDIETQSLVSQVEDYFEELYNAVQRDKLDIKLATVTASLEKWLRDQIAQVKQREDSTAPLSANLSKPKSKQYLETKLNETTLHDLRVVKKAKPSKQRVIEPRMETAGQPRQDRTQKTLPHLPVIVDVPSPVEVRARLERFIRVATYDNIVRLRSILSKFDPSILQKAEIEVYIEQLPAVLLKELSDFLNGEYLETPLHVEPSPVKAQRPAQSRQPPKKHARDGAGSSKSSFYSGKLGSPRIGQ